MVVKIEAQRRQNGVPKPPKFDEKTVKIRFGNLFRNMYPKMMKKGGLGTSKIVFSHWRGCTFQGFQHLRKVAKIISKLVPK